MDLIEFLFDALLHCAYYLSPTRWLCYFRHGILLEEEIQGNANLYLLADLLIWFALLAAFLVFSYALPRTPRSF